MRGAWLTLLGCLAAAVLLVLLTVPFPVLSGVHPHVDVARDFTSSEIAREKAFHAAGRPWAYGSIVVSLVFAGLLGLTRWGGRLVGGVPGHWTVKALAGTALVLALGQLVTLPLDIRAESVLRRYGLSTQTWAGWTDDRLRGLAVQVALTGIAVLVAYGARTVRLRLAAATMPQRDNRPPNRLTWSEDNISPWQGDI